MPLYCKFSRDMEKTLALAALMAEKRMALVAASLTSSFRSRSKNLDKIWQAVVLATSPAFSPPMPSQTMA